MRHTKPDMDIEKQLLIGLITSDNFVKRILPVFEYDYLDLETVRKMARWVVEYHQVYGKAPGLHIQDIFNEKKGRLKEEEADWMERFLVELDRRAEKSGGFNDEYLFRSCVKYFGKQKLRKNSEKVLDLLEADKQDQAERVWLDSVGIPEAGDLGIDPFDRNVVKKLFGREKERASLGLGIKSLDRMVGPVKTGWLGMFMGPMKRGKTKMLLHMAVRSVTKGYNTVFFSLETEEADNAKMIWSSVGSLASQNSELDFPYFGEDDKVMHETVSRPLLNMGNVLKAVKTFSRVMGGPKLRVKTFPMGTAGVDEFKKYLDLLEALLYFSPHVIIVDYLGNMKAPKGFSGRDVYNENSMALKALGQERDAIMFSAHQGSRATLEKVNMSPSDMPEDIRIFANVDALYGLLQTDKEKDEGIMRVNVLGHRHRKFTRMKQAKVLQQFGAGQFVLDDRIIDMPASKDLKKGEGLKDVEGEKR